MLTYPHHTMWYSLCDFRFEYDIILKLHIIKVKKKEGGLCKHQCVQKAT